MASIVARIAESTPERIVIEVEGDLDTVDAQFRAALVIALVRRRPRQVLIDLRRTTSGGDAFGIGALVAAGETASELGVHLLVQARDPAQEDELRGYGLSPACLQSAA